MKINSKIIQPGSISLLKSTEHKIMKDTPKLKLPCNKSWPKNTNKSLIISLNNTPIKKPLIKSKTQN
jgi:hypothetical protein